MRLTSLFLAASAAALVIGVSACSNTDNATNPTSSDLAAATGLKAISNSSQVTLWWTNSPDSANTQFNGYEVDVTAGGASVTQQIVPAGVSTATIATLTNGTVYTFTVYTLAKDGTKSSHTAAITWGPGARYNGIKLYSLSSAAACPSGLQLSPNGVRAVSVSQSPDQTDLVFDDRGTTMDILSPALKSGSSLPRHTAFARNIVDEALSLDDAGLARASIDTTVYAEGDYTLGKDNMGGGLNPNVGEVYYVKTQDGNYARVFIHGSATGSEIQTETAGTCAGTKYILIDVSFQPTAYVPYAGAQRTTGSGSH